MSPIKVVRIASSDRSWERLYWFQLSILGHATAAVYTTAKGDILPGHSLSPAGLAEAEKAIKEFFAEERARP